MYDIFLFFIFIFIPMNLSNSNIVKISFTNGTLVSFIFFASIDAAKIGRVEFLEPDTLITPDNCFFPLIKSFCMKENLNFWKCNAFLLHVFTFSFGISYFRFLIPFDKYELCYSFICIYFCWKRSSIRKF